MRRRARIAAGISGALAVVVALGAWVGVSGNGATPGLSLVSGDARPLAMSGDGLHLASVVAETLVVKDLRTGATTAVCRPTDYCRDPALSHDGRFVAFASNSTTLAPGGRTGKVEVFAKDLQTGTVRLLSRMPAHGRQRSANSPSISADGRRIAFVTGYAGAVTQRTWVADEAGTVTPIGERASSPRISADGNTVVFYSQAYQTRAPFHADGTRHIMLKDLRTGRLSSLYDRVKLGVTSDFYAIDYSAPSADGSRLAITLRSDRQATNPDWSGLYVVDIREGRVIHRLRTRAGRITQGSSPELSADGNHLMFASGDDNLVPRDRSHGQDVFVTDLRSGETRLVSAPRNLGPVGFEGPTSRFAHPFAISADGVVALFGSSNQQGEFAPPPPGSGGVYLYRADAES